MRDDAKLIGLTLDQIYPLWFLSYKDYERNSCSWGLTVRILFLSIVLNIVIIDFSYKVTKHPIELVPQ